jgi:hypothetical protein
MVTNRASGQASLDLSGGSGTLSQRDTEQFKVVSIAG